MVILTEKEISALLVNPVTLYSYKVAYDSGFAPNPFFGVLTLATCKPGMRRNCQPGHWVAGFTSGTLNGDPVGQERLVYLMKVDNRMTLGEYFEHPDFQCKKPNINSTHHVQKMGDNIYELSEERYVQHKNMNHSECDIPRDTRGKNVLISKNYVYFGSSPLKIPPEKRPDLPPGKSCFGAKTTGDRARNFIEFVLLLPSRPKIVTFYSRTECRCGAGSGQSVREAAVAGLGRGAV